MKRTLLAATPFAVLAAVAAVAPAQTATTTTPPAQDRFSLSEAFDLKFKPTPVLRVRVDTYTSKLKFLPKDFAIDLDGFLTPTTNLRVGMGLTHTWSKRFEVVDKFSPTLGLTLGAWTNYGMGSGKITGGPYLGFGASW